MEIIRLIIIWNLISAKWAASLIENFGYEIISANYCEELIGW